MVTLGPSCPGTIFGRVVYIWEMGQTDLALLVAHLSGVTPLLSPIKKNLQPFPGTSNFPQRAGTISRLPHLSPPRGRGIFHDNSRRALQASPTHRNLTAIVLRVPPVHTAQNRAGDVHRVPFRCSVLRHNLKCRGIGSCLVRLSAGVGCQRRRSGMESAKKPLRDLLPVRSSISLKTRVLKQVWARGQLLAALALLFDNNQVADVIFCWSPAHPVLSRRCLRIQHGV